MQIYDSKRVLTVREMRKGDTLHSGFIAGHCVTWHVLEILGTRALIQVLGSKAFCTGKDLRESPYYLAENCPNCAKQVEVKPSVMPELHSIPRELLAADVQSSFRFRAAQYGRKKTR